MSLFGKNKGKNEILETYKQTYTSSKEESTIPHTDKTNKIDKKSFCFGKSKELEKELALFEGKTLELEKELALIKEKNLELHSLLSPEMQEVEKIKNLINELTVKQTLLTADISDKDECINQLKHKILQLNNTISALNKAIIVNKETIELESFSLYRPSFDFVHAAEYKLKLDTIREKQKQMIKNNTAAIGAQSWTVNNSAAQGKKLVKDMIKLCLRSFNNECDAAINSVKFNNYDRCENRILKSAESIQTLGKIMEVSISHGYIKLKIEELKLALEYQMKKQQEKEELKELRAQQREEARVAKEIEEARKTVEKERVHYSKALEQILKQLETCPEIDRDNLLEKQHDLESRLTVIEENIKTLDYREANQKAGYVYIISNIGAFGENVYKIGMTRRLEPQDRVDELGDASVPYNFDVHAMIFSDNAPKLEADLHQAFEDKKLNMVNTRREFFNVTLDEIKKVVKESHDKTVEFIDVPIAEQYRESIKIREIK